MNFHGRNAFRPTKTCRRDRLLVEIEWQNPHKKYTDSSDKTKVARFFNPVYLTKNTEKVVENRTGVNGEVVEHVIIKAFQWVHL